MTIDEIIAAEIPVGPYHDALRVGVILFGIGLSACVVGGAH